MDRIPSGYSIPKPVELPRSTTGVTRSACLPLQFDIDTGALLNNSRNKNILSDINAALMSTQTPRTVVDTIIRHAHINQYTHVLKVIIQRLPAYPQALNEEDLALLGLHEMPFVEELVSQGGASLSSKSPTSETGTARIKMPASLDDYQPGALEKYHPVFLNAIVNKKYFESVSVKHSTTREPGNNNFSPVSGGITFAPPKDGSPSIFLGTMVHEFSHLRDYAVLDHAQRHKISENRSYSTTLSNGTLLEAEKLFTTELKAWLVESMQQYLVSKAGGEINRSQAAVIEGFRAGYQDILSGRYNGVQSRLLAYINGELSKPTPTIAALFGESNSPLGNALAGGAALFQHFCHVVDHGGTIDADQWINELDSLFHTEFYAVSALDAAKAGDLRVLDSLG